MQIISEWDQKIIYDHTFDVSSNIEISTKTQFHKNLLTFYCWKLNIKTTERNSITDYIFISKT